MLKLSFFEIEPKKSYLLEGHSDMEDRSISDNEEEIFNKCLDVVLFKNHFQHVSINGEQLISNSTTLIERDSQKTAKRTILESKE